MSEQKKPAMTAKRWNEKFSTQEGEMKKVDPNSESSASSAAKKKPDQEQDQDQGA